MIKNILCRPKGILFSFALLLATPQALRSQEIQFPSSWESFIQSTQNISVLDTFRMQTFSGLPSDNWSYTTQGETKIEDISKTDITDNTKQPWGHGTHGLRMSTESVLQLEHFALEPYNEVKIRIRKGGKNLVVGEEMKLRTFREGETDPINLVINIPSNGISSFMTTQINDNPPGLDVIVPKAASNTKGGYYYVDSIYAIGMIPSYSLFTGEGSWDDHERWSHLPADRYRKALVKGELSISSDVENKEIRVGEGLLHIQNGAKLKTESLTLYDKVSSSKSTSFISQGLFDLSGDITIIKQFTEKGKWYFFSLPFDVYPSGIDPDFSLGDASSDTDGNYFYLCEYDGERRASQQSQVGNWKVISKESFQNSDSPLIQKNKGYLIALDAAAETNTIRFSSQPGDIPSDFGEKGEISVHVGSQRLTDTQEHQGWVLCGNPLPAPLSLQQIEENQDLDGYIYFYEGDSYQPYAIGSDHAIPAYSSFFVKAKQDTRLSIKVAEAKHRNNQVLMANPLTSLRLEPSNKSFSPDESIQVEESSIDIQIQQNQLIIQGLTEPGHVEIFSLNGTRMVYYSLSPAGNNIPLSIQPGMYIIHVKSGNLQVHKKCLLKP